jgi:hypothetical protein
MRKLAAVALAISSVVLSANPALSKPFDGWYLKQKMDYHGTVEIYAANEGVKIKTRSLCVYLKPDNSAGTVVNETNKTQTVVDRRLWTDSNMMSDGLSKEVGPDVLKKFKIPVKPPKLIAGHKCIQHWAVAYRHDHSFWFWWEYWTPTDMKLPVSLAGEWRTILHLPTGDTIPFYAARHFHMNQSNHSNLVWINTDIAKKTTLLATDLVPPKGYKKVGDEMDMVLGGDDKNDEISALFGTKGGAKKK